MALKAIMLRRRIEAAQAALDTLTTQGEALRQRETELEQAINEATTDEEMRAVEESLNAYESERSTHDAAVAEAEAALEALKNELAETEARSAAPVAAPIVAQEGVIQMPTTETRTSFFGLTPEARSAFIGAKEVKDFLAEFRKLGKTQRSISGAQLTFPVTVLDLVRSEVSRTSKLLPFVRRRRTSGEGRQNIMGDIPEAVWTEMCANLNELEFGFNQVTTDGYKLGGYIVICNGMLEDSDQNLAAEIISALATAMAKGIDKAILFGKGGAYKQPLGITTRLAQTSQPESWGANAPAWTDLHTTHILKLNILGSSGPTFFTALASALSAAVPKYSSDGLFWVMNRKTHMDIMAKALTFNAAGALVSSTNGTLPVIGGTIVIMEDSDAIQDYEIIGGYGDNYLWVDRGGENVGKSDQPFWLSDQTAFKHSSRHDGMPLAGEAFVVLNYNNMDAEVAKNFAFDYANTEMNLLTVVAAAGTASGDTVLTVSDTVDTGTPSLYYKIRANINTMYPGEELDSTWEELTSGTTQITAAAGKIIAVAEVDAADRVISVGSAASVPKT